MESNTDSGERPAFNTGGYQGNNNGGNGSYGSNGGGGYGGNGSSSSGSSGNSGYNFATNRGPNAIGSSSNASNNWQPTGGGSNNNNNNNSNNNYNGNGSNASPSQPAPPSVSLVGQLGKAGAAATDGAYEQAMVAGLCEPGGLKPVPPEDKLRAFLQAAPTLAEDVIGVCLLEQLNRDEWQSRTKALMVVSALVGCASCPLHLVWWEEHEGDVRAMLTDSKVGVRTQAAKTLSVLSSSVRPDSPLRRGAATATATTATATAAAPNNAAAAYSSTAAAAAYANSLGTI